MSTCRIGGGGRHGHHRPPEGEVGGTGDARDGEAILYIGRGREGVFGQCMQIYGVR